ncbi:MAG: GspE/PulE family protein [Firmicutes bacterium]|nr:GspE/PulE family protein [Bacillota bacterium]
MAPKRLGDILVDAKLISPAQLSSALEVQKASGARLGEILVGMGLVNEVDVARVLAQQTGLPFLPPQELKVNPAATRLIPEGAARQHRLLALSADDTSVTVAMADPLNVFALDEVALLTKKKVKPVVSTGREIEKALQRAYQLGTAEEIPAATEEELEVFRLRELVEEAPVVRLVNNVIERAIQEGASDIHLEPQENLLRVRYRIDGLLQEVMTQPKSVHSAVISRIKIMAGLDISIRRLPQDGRIEIRDRGRNVDLRVSTLPTIHGEKVVIRLLDKRSAITRLESLGFLPKMLEGYLGLIQKPFGMILITGPTGSGKTTTLTATLHRLNTPEKNIITVEDPVEYEIPGVNQVQLNEKAGLTFSSGLRSILRQDPNIIMVGEIRDLETAEIAVRSALTGHLVLSTVHTNDAAGALTRLVDMGVEPFLIASSVVGVVAQRLARSLCSSCRVPYPLPEEAPERLSFGLGSGEMTFYLPRGCRNCGDNGYRGRLPLFELLTVSPAIRALVMERVSSAEIRRQAVREGMATLLEDGLAKARAGLTTLEEVRRVAYSQEE